MKRKVRALSGWNCFQREQLRCSTLDPAKYKQAMKDISKKWKALSDDDKEAFHVQARYEQSLREQLATTPLTTRTESKTTTVSTGPTTTQILEDQVGRSGCKKLSSRRLAVNETSKEQHPLWSSATQLGDCDLD